MSYLQTPRLHFSGKFQADPSTVNNDPEHFNTSDFQSNYNLTGTGATNGWWNPAGTGSWKLYGCTVQRVTYNDGTNCDDPLLDPIIGTPVTGADARVAGKLVDLDPEQQMVSEIWGFQITLGDKDTGLGFTGDFETAAFADIWVRFPGGRPDSFFGAFYQSVLFIKDWVNTSNSRYLRELSNNAGISAIPKMLSIKISVDGFNDDQRSPEFTFGRITGSIGLQNANEPHHFIPGRVLNPAPGAGLNTAYAALHGNTLTIDLGNSLPTVAPGGALASQGPLYAAILPASGAPIMLGEIYYQSPGWYEQSAGIVTLALTEANAVLAEGSPIAIANSSLFSSASPAAPLLVESANGQCVRADQFVYRMNPGERKIAMFYSSQFGKPLPEQQISLIYDPTQMQGQATQGPIPGPQILGQPQSAFTFPASITTNAKGYAELPMTAGDPGNPRVYIDGQLYGIAYQLGAAPPPVGSIQNPSQIISAIVYSGFEIPSEPTWMENIQPIFQQYADLYPVMRPIVDLSNYANVVQKLYILKNVFSMDINNPNYMPVTRDLSEAKRQMIRKWLDAPVYMRFDSVENVKTALQIAIELEHSTIPPYLCALYSIKPGVNTEAAGLIRSIVMEEMLHVALISNVLIAIGGAPKIGNSRFIPQYPSSLPGGLRSGLRVRLRKCSIEQIRECFMSIEEPEEITQMKYKQFRSNMQSGTMPYTIGWFYNEIITALKDLSSRGKIAFGNTEKQVLQWGGSAGTLYVIGSLADAIKAITEIKDQGEGTGVMNPNDENDELAHYYKFAEIAEGRRLIKEGKTYSFTGRPIAFDPAGVWNMIDDPNIVMYPAGSRAQILDTQFSQSYKALLQGLNRTFNGDPDYLKNAVGAMYDLEIIARQLMMTPSGVIEGATAGPSFQVL